MISLVNKQNNPYLTTLLETLILLENTLDLEEEAHKIQNFSDTHQYNLRKNQCLLEIERVQKLIDPHLISDINKTQIKRIKKKLLNNCKILSLHLHAMYEIAATLSKVIQDAESDGTYTRYQNSRSTSK